MTHEHNGQLLKRIRQELAQNQIFLRIVEENSNLKTINADLLDALERLYQAQTPGKLTKREVARAKEIARWAIDKAKGGQP